ncbi:hypothetical protein KAU43_03745 [candidate division WOR-3 bacterium]|nr:hypothetical protein [candidate division WOR-3 bacterium]
MSDEYKIKQLAKGFLDHAQASEIYEAQRLLKVAWSEYQDRTQKMDHLNDEQKLDRKHCIIDAITKQHGVDMQLDLNHFDKLEGTTIISKEAVRMGVMTKYLYVSGIDGEDFKTALNKDIEVLVSLIHKIAKGRY